MRFSKFTVICHLCQLKNKRTTNTCCPSAELGFCAAVMEHQDQKQLGEERVDMFWSQSFKN